MVAEPQNTTNLMDQTDHRPWPLPARPWVMAQSWHDLLFAHWPIPAPAMRALLPPNLEMETFDGQAWVALVPFRMSGVRPRLLPAVPWLSNFPELNVRTYVRVGKKAGVFFFSLDAANPIAVALGRTIYHLPYFRAVMRCERVHESGPSAIRYRSQRTHRGAPAAMFAGGYGPVGEPYRVQPGTLEHWLIERYCLYAMDSRGTLYRGEIHHRPWPIQPAEAEFEINQVPQAHGISLPQTKPLLHFARRLDVVAWAPERVG